MVQHAHNPVDWYPWGPEAFERAKREDKPIFLSIGYSTCHWCHVMAHESFEDIDVARLMNDSFVSIKVDREERPDIDKVYMEVAQLMTGQGGWPLTIIMTPEKEPFFAATYVPKSNRYGQIGMDELIPKVKNLWEHSRASVDELTQRIQQALVQEQAAGDSRGLGRHALDQAYDTFVDTFDERNAGFGTAPKFPAPHNLVFLLRYWKRTGDSLALHMVEKSLMRMRDGGIFDHVGFGFHRYSVDAEWLVPHFEKMLYDQAMHIMAYTEAYQATRRTDLATTVDEIVQYLTRDLMSPDGAFFSAEDADSEGEEGRFYVWTAEELEQVLTPVEARVFQRVYNVKPSGNYIEETSTSSTGMNILHRREELDTLARELHMEEKELERILAEAKAKVLARRSTRVRPHLDDKILADWNGMVVAALARAGTALGRQDYLRMAERAMQFVLGRLVCDGELRHSYTAGTPGARAFLDDYAFVVWGLLELYEATLRPMYLRQAVEHNAKMTALFKDNESGGFFFTSSESEPLLIRTKDAYDGAYPSGNSIALYNLVRLARLLGDSLLEDAAAETAQAFSGVLQVAPQRFTMMLAAIDHLIGPSYEVVIAGDTNSEDTDRMLRALRGAYLPNLSLILRGDEAMSSQVSELAPYTRFYNRVNGQATAHVCVQKVCKLPTNDPQTMLKQIGS